MKYSFDWDAAKEASNRRKHRISFRQAATVFQDPRQISIYDERLFSMKSIVKTKIAGLRLE